MTEFILIAKNSFGVEFLIKLKKIYECLQVEGFFYFDSKKCSYPRLANTCKRGIAGFKELKTYLPCSLPDQILVMLCKLPKEIYDNAFNKINNNYPVLSPSPFIFNNNLNLLTTKYIHSKDERDGFINTNIINFYLKSQEREESGDAMENIKNVIEFYDLPQNKKIELVKWILG